MSSYLIEIEHINPSYSELFLDIQFEEGVKPTLIFQISFFICSIECTHGPAITLDKKETIDDAITLPHS